MEALFKKLHFTSQATIVDAPPELADAFTQMGCHTTYHKKTPSTNTLLFIQSKDAFIHCIKNTLQTATIKGVLWIAYPKGTSKIKTDINRDILRETAETFGITTVSAISINETWSALRFKPIGN